MNRVTVTVERHWYEVAVSDDMVCLVTRVRVFDCSSPRPVQVLAGHRGQVCSVQMDGWKVVSGRSGSRPAWAII